MIRKIIKNLFGGSESSQISFPERPQEAPPNDHSIEPPAKTSTVIIGYRFSATCQPTTPLTYLERHGETAEFVPDREQEAVNRFYRWLPELKSKYAFLSKGRTMSSSVGYIDPDGGEFLPFLIALRNIVERPLTSDQTDYQHALAKVDELLALGRSSLTNAADYFQKLFSGPNNDLLSFVLREQGSPSYDGLSIQHLEQLNN
jgi:hypothetical protein